MGVYNQSKLKVEWFEHKSKSPKITISYYGLNLSRSLITWMNSSFGYSDFVEIGIVKDKNWLVIKPVSEETDKSFKVIKYQDYVRISSKDLVRFIKTHTNDNYRKSKSFPVVYDDGIKGFVADLDEISKRMNTL